MKTKKDPRHLARKVSLQALYQWSSRKDFPDRTQEDTIKDLIDSLAQNDEYAEQKILLDMAYDIVLGVLDHQHDIDPIIETCAPEWPVDQISRVDVNVIRMAIYELLYKNKAPVKVIIDEAVEIAKEYGSDASSKFVNGVLGTVVKEYDPIQHKDSDPQHDEK